MRKILLTLSILGLFFEGSAPGYKWLVQLTIINQSGLPVEISLKTADEDNIYYLRIPRGDRTNPVEKTYTIVPAVYQATLYYVELWDPVYGYSCSSKSQSINANRKLQLVVFECNRTIAKPGEIPKIKFGATGGGRRR